MKWIIPCLFLAGGIWAGEGPADPLAHLDALLQTEGVAAAKQKYEAYLADEDEKPKLSFWAVNALANRLLGEGRIDHALAVYTWNQSADPNKVFGLLSLAAGYRAAGQDDEARTRLREVVRLTEAADVPAHLKAGPLAEAARQLLILDHFKAVAPGRLRVTTHFGGSPAGQWDAENLAAFLAANPGLEIAYESHNFYASPVPQISAAFLDGKEADVIQTYLGGDYRRYAKAGKLADLSGLWHAKGWDKRFAANFKAMGAVDGKPYFVPQAYQANPVFYRKDLFDKHGLKPPKTWDELLALCKTLNKKGIVPFSISVAQWPPPVARWFSMLNLRLHGADFHQRLMAGEVAYTDARVRAVFEHWKELFEHKAFAPDSAGNNYAKGVKDLFEGKAAMYLLGEWLFESRAGELGDKLDFFVFPPMKAGVPRAEIVHVYGACLAADTPRRDQAEKLLAFLADAPSQAGNVRQLKRTQPNREVDDALYTPMQRRLIAAVESADSLVPLFEFNTHPTIARAGLKAFSQFWSDQSDIDGLLRDLERARQEAEQD